MLRFVPKKLSSGAGVRAHAGCSIFVGIGKRTREGPETRARVLLAKSTVTEYFPDQEGRNLPILISCRFFSSESKSNDAATNISEPTVEQLEDYQHDIEMLLNRLKFEYGANPNADVILRALAVRTKELNDARNELLLAKNDLRQCYERALQAEVTIVLTSHVEIVEETLLVGNPVPTSVTSYTKFCKEQGKVFDKDLEDVIAGKSVPKIKWPNRFEENLKDSTKVKVNKHFVTWYWIMYTSNFQFVDNIKKELEASNVSLFEFCSGIAGLQIFDNALKHIRPAPYTRNELMSALNANVHSSVITKAVELLLKFTWIDQHKRERE